MNFSKTTSYALSILSHMAREPEKLYSAKYLNQALGIPKQYLRHLLTELSKDGFIASTQGRSGGFSLCKDPKEVYLVEIVKAVEGGGIFSTCIMGFRECPFDEKCAMHETWEGTRTSISQVLESTSLQSLLHKDSK